MSTIWEWEINGEAALATIDEIMAGISGLLDTISQVVQAGADLAPLDDALSQVQASTDAASSSATGMSEAFNGLAAQIAEDTAIISGLNETVVNLEAQISALTVQETAATSVMDILAGAAASLSGALAGVGEALTAAQGPLLMLVTAAGVLGGTFLSAGMQGQQGLSLVKGMAGATTQDVQNLEAAAIQLGDTVPQAAAGFYDVASAGYTGSQAITVFTDATKAAKASQSDLHSVTSALTSELAAYGAGSDQAGKYTDQMVEAVLVGKQSFQDFASAIGPLAAVGHNVGLSFSEVASAEATMTQINPNVRQDTNELRFLFTAMDMSMDKVKNTASSLNLKFNETHYASLSLIDKLKYLAEISGGTNTVAFSKMVGGVNGVNAALDLLNKGGSTYATNLQKIQNSAGATDKAFAQSEQTIGASLDKVGAALSVFATQAADVLGPRLIPLLDALSARIGQFTDFAIHHTDQLMPVLAGLAAIVGGAVIGALVALVISAGPVLAALAGIGLAVAGLTYVWQHWSEITHTIEQAFQTRWQQLSTSIKDLISNMSSSVRNTFEGLVGWFKGKLTEIAGAVGDATGRVIGWFHTWEPVIKGVATTLAVIFGPALIQTGIQAGIAGTRIAASFIAQLAASGTAATVNAGRVTASFVASMVKTGAQSIITGAQVSASFIASIIKAGVQATITGAIFVAKLIPAILASAASMISTAVPAIISVIAGMSAYAVAGWAAAAATLAATWPFLLLAAAIGLAVIGIIAAVQHWGQIVAWMQSVWTGFTTGASAMMGKMKDGVASGAASAGAAIQNFVSQASSLIMGMVNGAFKWGADLIGNIAGGIKSAIGSVTSAVGNVTSAIAAPLHHSKPDIGPLKDDDKWGAELVSNLTTGIDTQIGRVKASAMSVAQSLALSQPSVAPPSMGGFGTGGSVHARQQVALLSQILAVLLTISQKGPAAGGQILLQTTGGSTNPLSYAQLQSIGGYAYQDLVRGAGGLG